MPSTGGEAASAGAAAHRPIRLSGGAVAVLVGAVLVAMMARSVFVAAHRPLGWAVAAAVVALLLEPVVSRLDDVLPRPAALATALVAIAAAAGGLVYGVFGDLAEEAARLEREAPAAAARLEARDDGLGSAAREAELERRVAGFVDAVGERVGSSGDAVRAAAGTVPTYLVGTVLTVFLLAGRRRMVDAAVAQVRDDERRRRIAAVTRTAIARAQGYLAAAIAQGAAVGVLVGLVAWMADLPAPVVLGVLGAILGLVPVLGVFLAAVAPALLAAGFSSVATAVGILAGAVALQVLEARFVRPRLDRATLHVGPAIPVVVALLGFELYGLGGALYAAAVAVVLLAFADAAATDDEEAEPPERDTTTRPNKRKTAGAAAGATSGTGRRRRARSRRAGGS